MTSRSPTRWGGRSTPKRLTDEFREQRKLAGITHGSLHTLRHTATTIALCNGIPVHVVAARAGDTPATILSVYAHLLPTSDEEAAQAIAAALSGVS
jgi:integrase